MSFGLHEFVRTLANKKAPHNVPSESARTLEELNSKKIIKWLLRGSSTLKTFFAKQLCGTGF